jgi:hypothetical protein
VPNILHAERIVGDPPHDHDPIILHLQFSQKKRDKLPSRPKKARIACKKLNNPARESKGK